MSSENVNSKRIAFIVALNQFKATRSESALTAAKNAVGEFTGAVKEHLRNNPGDTSFWSTNNENAVALRNLSKTLLDNGIYLPGDFTLGGAGGIAWEYNGRVRMVAAPNSDSVSMFSNTLSPGNPYTPGHLVCTPSVIYAPSKRINEVVDLTIPTTQNVFMELEFNPVTRLSNTGICGVNVLFGDSYASEAELHGITKLYAGFENHGTEYPLNNRIGFKYSSHSQSNFGVDLQDDFDREKYKVLLAYNHDLKKLSVIFKDLNGVLHAMKVDVDEFKLSFMITAGNSAADVDSYLGTHIVLRNKDNRVIESGFDWEGECVLHDRVDNVNVELESLVTLTNDNGNYTLNIDGVTYGELDTDVIEPVAPVDPVDPDPVDPNNMIYKLYFDQTFIDDYYSELLVSTYIEFNDDSKTGLDAYIGVDDSIFVPWDLEKIQTLPPRNESNDSFKFAVRFTDNTDPSDYDRYGYFDSAIFNLGLFGANVTQFIPDVGDEDPMTFLVMKRQPDHPNGDNHDDIWYFGEWITLNKSNEYILTFYNVNLVTKTLSVSLNGSNVKTLNLSGSVWDITNNKPFISIQNIDTSWGGVEPGGVDVELISTIDQVGGSNLSTLNYNYTKKLIVDSMSDSVSVTGLNGFLLEPTGDPEVIYFEVYMDDFDYTTGIDNLTFNIQHCINVGGNNGFISMDPYSGNLYVDSSNNGISFVSFNTNQFSGAEVKSIGRGIEDWEGLNGNKLGVLIDQRPTVGGIYILYDKVVNANVTTHMLKMHSSDYIGDIFSINSIVSGDSDHFIIDDGVINDVVRINHTSDNLQLYHMINSPELVLDADSTIPNLNGVNVKSLSTANQRFIDISFNSYGNKWGHINKNFTLFALDEQTGGWVVRTGPAGGNYNHWDLHLNSVFNYRKLNGYDLISAPVWFRFNNGNYSSTSDGNMYSDGFLGGFSIRTGDLVVDVNTSPKAYIEFELINERLPRANLRDGDIDEGDSYTIKIFNIGSSVVGSGQDFSEWHHVTHTAYSDVISRNMYNDVVIVYLNHIEHGNVYVIASKNTNQNDFIFKESASLIVSAEIDFQNKEIKYDVVESNGARTTIYTAEYTNVINMETSFLHRRDRHSDYWADDQETYGEEGVIYDFVRVNRSPETWKHQPHGTYISIDSIASRYRRPLAASNPEARPY